MKDQRKKWNKIRTVLSFWEMGKGYESIELFTILINLLHLSSKPSCNNISDILYGTYKKTVDKLAASVAEELKRKFKWNSKKVEKSNLNDTQNCQMAF